MGFASRMVVRCFLAVGLCIGFGVGCAELESRQPLLRDLRQGASAGAMEAGKSAVMDRLAELSAKGKLSPEEAAELSRLVDSVPNPESPSPMGNGVVYGLAFLIAKILGDSLKGLVRRKLDKSGKA